MELYSLFFQARYFFMNAAPILEFVSELSFGLLFGVIGDHGWGHTIALEYKGQGLMSIPYALNWVSMCPNKRFSIPLGHCIALAQNGPGK